jgi:hypothetical protein
MCLSSPGISRSGSQSTPSPTFPPTWTPTRWPTPTYTLWQRSPTTVYQPTVGPAPRPCCKICTKGKACGDTCISRDKTCHKPPGCACNAW